MGELGTTVHWPPEIGPEEEIVFSSRDGFVWASWPGTKATIRLGGLAIVTYMMEDFLAQEEIGKRLSVADPPPCSQRGVTDTGRA